MLWHILKRLGILVQYASTLLCKHDYYKVPNGRNNWIWKIYGGKEALFLKCRICGKTKTQILQHRPTSLDERLPR